MIRKSLKKLSKNTKFRDIIKKYRIPPNYLLANRKTASRAVAIGLFIGFIPMPMQMLAVISMIPLIRFNVIIAISMVWLSNPFTMPFMYYMEYQTGCFILNIQPEPLSMTLEWFATNLKNIFIPLYAGTLFYSVSSSILSYYLINRLWINSTLKDRKIHRKNRA